MDLALGFRSATVVGWHGHRNTGDDAMLRVITWALATKLGVSAVSLIASPGRMATAVAKGVEARAIYSDRQRYVSFLNPGIRRRAARDSDLLVFGGGSLFHSANSIRWKAEMLAAARRHRPSHPALALGISLGPFRTSAEEKMCATFLGELDVVSVRDRASRDFADQTALRRPVILSPDLALALPRASERMVLPGRGQASAVRALGVSLRPAPAGPIATETLIRETTTGIRALVQDGTVSEVRLLTFCGDRTMGDTGIMKELERRLSDIERVRIVQYHPEPMEMLQAVAECSVLVGMRLHSQVFAYIAGVPFVALDYERKCTDFMRSIEASESLIVPVDRISHHNVEAAARHALDSAHSPIQYEKLEGAVVAALETLKPTILS